MTCRELSLDEFEYITDLMREAQTTFREINWGDVEALGKGHIGIYENPVYGERTIKEKILGRPASRRIGTENIELYDMVVLMNPYESARARETGTVILSAETTFSANMKREMRDNEILKLEGKLYGPNHSPNMTYDFRPDTVVFPLKEADLDEILAVQETRL